MSLDRPFLVSWLLAAALLSAIAPAEAITISIDYSYDSSNFFGSGNPQGAAAGDGARDALEAAAGFLSTILDDTFSPIQTPPDYFSSVFNGHVHWGWSLTFRNPSTSTPTDVTLFDETFAADEYRIYAGARNLTGGVIGAASPGVDLPTADIIVNEFTASEVAELTEIHNEFVSAVQMRGEPSGFARWGGQVAFDNVGTNWNYDYGNPPVGGTSDFYSVALHELVHALGFGEFFVPPSISVWESLINASNEFLGSSAVAEYGGNVPLYTDDLAHWEEDTDSHVFGGAASQETLMDPNLTVGMRKLLTDLDAAALTDIGWTVVEPPGLDGDYNQNGVIDAADYAVWRDNVGGSIPNDHTPGLVNDADYAYWRAHFGDTLGSGSLGGGAPGGGSATVPEPATSTLLLLATLLARLTCGPRRPRR